MPDSGRCIIRSSVFWKLKNALISFSLFSLISTEKRVVYFYFAVKLNNDISDIAGLHVTSQRPCLLLQVKPFCFR